MIPGNIFSSAVIQSQPAVILTTFFVVIIVSFLSADRKFPQVIAKKTDIRGPVINELEKFNYTVINQDTASAFFMLAIKGCRKIYLTFGYEFILELITEYSLKLKKTFEDQKNIQLFRYGEFEFFFVVCGKTTQKEIADIASALEKINRINIEVKNIPIYVEHVYGMHVSNFHVRNEYVEDAVKYSSIALRYAMENRKPFSCFNTDMEAKSIQSISYAGVFREEMAKGNFKIAYQKIFSSDTLKSTEAEILIRWITDERKNIPPDQFIPIIAQTDLIHELTTFVIDKAISFLKYNKDGIQSISINFSFRDLNRRTISHLMNVINKNGLMPEQIQIELTEETLIYGKSVIEDLKLLKSAGCGIVVDDFGSGFSSLQYLSNLPLDIVKIDRILINEAHINKRTFDLLNCVTQFCGKNNIQVVAEGVETREHVIMCKKIGIDLLQGYYFHKPQIIGDASLNETDQNTDHIKSAELVDSAG